MIEKCDQDVACWSESGDNFVVKNLEEFSKVSNIMKLLLPALHGLI